MLFTSYFANRALPKDANLISICLYPPKGFGEYLYPLLAPTPEILKDYKSGKIDEKEYSIRYYNEVLFYFNPINIVHYLDFGPLNILLCYERPEQFCHRHLFRTWLNEIWGYDIIFEY